MSRSLFTLILLVPALVTAEEPLSLWIAPLEGRLSLEDAWSAGAVVRDELPEALIVTDPGSAGALAAAGFRVHGPVPATPDRNVFLLRPLGEASSSTVVDVAGVENAPGVDILWSNGFAFIVEVKGELPTVDPILRLGKKALSRAPLDRPRVVPAERGLGRATTFLPMIDQLVTEVDSTNYFPWIERLAGEETVMVGGNPVTFATRYTRASQCDLAEQYVYERFVAMGFPQVEYHHFTVGGTPARNVIATLPGVETPEQIYVLCGHLDSTSPSPYTDAPGANDNASGSAAVLAAAEIMRNYSFRSTIRFVLFTGEEQGLVGSDYYAADAAAAGDDIRGVVNCDMIAFSDLRYEVMLQTKVWCEDLMLLLRDACETYTGLGTDLRYFVWGSDHVSFLQRGFPAAMAIELDYAQYDCYHQTCDRADRNHGSFGADVTRASMATIAQLAEIMGSTPVEESVTAGKALALESRPNPFGPGTSIRFTLESEDAIDLAIYDVAGRRIRTLARGTFGAGLHERGWDGLADDGTPSPAGVYFSRLTGTTTTISEKLVRLR